ncbi:hypothetical protein B0T22DRAFT_151629 [Podospora appendiculata]|uniref:Uncharacterized protein n=1 Tax=Podospora appendiculata TaxID=314037 RepID=A0AAE0X9I7_9PEZI|nr:hypothetical protein B0T22DRAFT_151629 [Podospora appendiculata]
MPPLSEDHKTLFAPENCSQESAHPIRNYSRKRSTAWDTSLPDLRPRASTAKSIERPDRNKQDQPHLAELFQDVRPVRQQRQEYNQPYGFDLRRAFDTRANQFKVVPAPGADGEADEEEGVYRSVRPLHEESPTFSDLVEAPIAFQDDGESELNGDNAGYGELVYSTSASSSRKEPKPVPTKRHATNHEHRIRRGPFPVLDKTPPYKKLKRDRDSQKAKYRDGDGFSEHERMLFGMIPMAKKRKQLDLTQTKTQKKAPTGHDRTPLLHIDHRNLKRKADAKRAPDQPGDGFLVEEPKTHVMTPFRKKAKQPSPAAAGIAADETRTDTKDVSHQTENDTDKSATENNKQPSSDPKTTVDAVIRPNPNMERCPRVVQTLPRVNQESTACTSATISEILGEPVREFSPASTSCVAEEVACSDLIIPSSLYPSGRMSVLGEEANMILVPETSPIQRKRARERESSTPTPSAPSAPSAPYGATKSSPNQGEPPSDGENVRDSMSCMEGGFIREDEPLALNSAEPVPDDDSLETTNAHTERSNIPTTPPHGSHVREGSKRSRETHVSRAPPQQIRGNSAPAEPYRPLGAAKEIERRFKRHHTK